MAFNPLKKLTETQEECQNRIDASILYNEPLRSLVEIDIQITEYAVGRI